MKIACTLFLVITVLQVVAQVKPDKFEIRGNVQSTTNKIVKVQYRYNLNGQPVDDSAVVKNNQYVLTGTIDEHVMLQTTAEYADKSLPSDYRRDYNTIHITPGTKATATHGETFSIATIKGSAAHDEYMMLHTRLVKGETDFIPEYISKHPGSPLALFLLQNFIIGPFPDVEAHEPIFNALAPEMRNSPSGRKLAAKFVALKNTAEGKVAPDISQADASGKVIRLSDLKGKYVLIEFWASWCAPCRKENPELVRVYNAFKPRGFEILGISLDENKNSWLAAVAKDGLPWINTADLKDSDKNPAALTYGVSAIPDNFLVGPDGKIVGRNLRGERLENTLKALLH